MLSMVLDLKFANYKSNLDSFEIHLNLVSVAGHSIQFRSNYIPNPNLLSNGNGTLKNDTPVIA
jgi:hypothetical protein